jgi:pSer/pThr/pTyr-binding forkhead associated (FHA) protein
MKLQITSAGKTREFVPRDGMAGVTIGRRAGLDIVLEDAGVSELHLRIDRFLDTWTFTDQMSDTGTQHNGETKYSGDLSDGDVLKLGEATIKVLSVANAAGSQHVPSSIASWQQPPDPAPVMDTPPAPSPRPRPAKTSASQTRITPIQQDWQQIIAPGKPQPTQKRAGVLIAVVVMVIVFSGVVFSLWSEKPAPPEDGPVSYGEDIQPRPEPRPAREGSATVPEPPPPPRDPTRLTSEEEQAYREKITALQKDTDTPPEKRLIQLDELEKETAEYKGHSLKYHISRAKQNVEIQLSTQMQRRYGQDQNTIYSLRENRKYSEASECLESFAEYCDSSDYHKDWTKRHDFTKYIESERERLTELSERWVGDQLSAADEALLRDDFTVAAEALEETVAQALLGTSVAIALKAEAAAHREAAIDQAAGTRGAAREAFDPRKDRLPPAEPSTLLPQGERSSLRSETRLRQRLEKLVVADDFSGFNGVHHGYTARIERYHYGRVYIKVSRPIRGDDNWSYTVVQPFRQLPGSTRGAFYERLPDLSQNERVGILMLYFDNGLLDDAARVACDLWKAHPEVKEDLDKLLATKLRITVPEGGFIEKDDRLVAPE